MVELGELTAFHILGRRAGWGTGERVYRIWELVWLITKLGAIFRFTFVSDTPKDM